jgi:hypothetical protein
MWPQVSWTPQHFRRGVACRTAAHDDDVLGRFRRAGRAEFPLGRPLAHEELAVAGFNLPEHDRGKGERAQRLARAKTETGVMPRAANGIADDETGGQRGAVMC